MYERDGMKLKFRFEVALHRDPKSMRCVVCGAVTYNAREIRSWTTRYDDRPPAEVPYICIACRGNGCAVEAGWDEAEGRSSRR